jgi:hypothetical protein
MKLQPRLGATNLYCTTVLNLFSFLKFMDPALLEKGHGRRERVAGETWLAAAVPRFKWPVASCLFPPVSDGTLPPTQQNKTCLVMSHLQFDRI